MASSIAFAERTFSRRAGNLRHEFTGQIPDGESELILRIPTSRWTDVSSHCEMGIEVSFDGGATWPFNALSCVEGGGDLRAENQRFGPQESYFKRAGIPLAPNRLYRIFVKPIENKVITIGPASLETRVGTRFDPPVHNSIAFDAASSVGKGGVGGFTNVTWTHTTGSLTNGFLIIGNTWYNTPTVSAVTYNGDVVSKIDSDAVNSSIGNKCSQFYRLAPDSGSNSVSVTISANIFEYIGGAITLSGVNQSTPLRAQAVGFQVRAQADSATASVVAGSAATDWVVDVVSRIAGGLVTPGAGQTERWDLEATVGNGLFGNGSTEIATGATTTMSHTLASSGFWCQCAVAIIEASGASPINSTATPAVVPISVPSPASTSLISSIGTPVAVNLSVQNPVSTLTSAATATPVTVNISVPSPVGSAGPVSATATPVQVNLVIPNPASSLTTESVAEPTVITLTIPNPSGQLVTDSVAEPIAVNISVPSPSGSLGSAVSTATPVVIPIVIPSPASELEADSIATPAIVALNISPPVGSTQVSSTATPVLVPIVAPVPVGTVQAQGVATPTIVNIVVPSPVGTLTGDIVSIATPVAVNILVPAPKGSISTPPVHGARGWTRSRWAQPFVNNRILQKIIQEPVRKQEPIKEIEEVFASCTVNISLTVLRAKAEVLEPNVFAASILKLNVYTESFGFSEHPVQQNAMLKALVGSEFADKPTVLINEWSDVRDLQDVQEIAELAQIKW